MIFPASRASPIFAAILEISIIRSPPIPLKKSRRSPIGLFGITQWDTEWQPPAQTFSWTEAEDGFEAFEQYEAEQTALREEAEEYEAQFHPTRVPWPEIQPFWQALGWDMSDGDGAELISGHCFARQIIAIARDLVDGAKLTLGGGGEWSVPGGDEVDEETLEQRLKREADAFMARRGR